jgi:glycine/sarcosine/betaine reductase complex component A
MDLEEQETIKKVAADHLGEDLLVLLGSPDVESARLYAQTVTTGDPSWAGPLAGVQLGLPVYHVLEDAVKQEIDSQVYADNVALMELSLDRGAIVEAMEDVRDSSTTEQ